MSTGRIILAAVCLCLPVFAVSAEQKVYSAPAHQSAAATRAAKPKVVSSSVQDEQSVKAKLPPLEVASIPAATAKKSRLWPAANQKPIGATQPLPEPIRISNPPGAGWQRLADRRWLWSGEITAENAQGIRIHLANLRLPPSAVLRVFAAESAEAEIDHSAATLNGKRELWTETVFSDTAGIEIVLPADWNGEEVSASISEIIHRWKSQPIAASGPGDDDVFTAAAAGPCNLDVSCFPAWVNTSKSIAGVSVVSAPLEILCSGTLLADSNNSHGTDYFLTGNHCIPNQIEADTAEFYWLYQTATCNGPAPALDSVPRTVGGARLLGTADELLGNDFCFLRLNNPPPAGVTYAGWTTSAPVGAVTTIHHPSGDYKRISLGTSEPADHYWTVVWNQGTTEPGSNGAGLFNANHQVIGQLRGGNASCETPTGEDVCGRFDVTFATIGNWLLGLPTTVANDNFANATTITGASGTITGNSAGATKETGEPDHAGNSGGMSIWYRWTAPSSGQFVFTSGGSTLDTTLAVYTGTAVDSLNQLARGDDSFDLTSVVVFTAITGNTYYIALDGYNGQGGALQLNWAPAQTRNFASAAPITINDLNPASPYPATITLNNVSGLIGQLAVRLEGLNHSYLSDIGVMVESPTGETILLMDFVGDAINAQNLSLIFHPQATQYLPYDDPIPNGARWLPTSYFADTFFSPPAPEPPYTFNLDSVFGADPNGTWNLFVEDFEPGDTGSLSRWQLDISTFDNPLRITGIRALGPDSVVISFRTIPAYNYQVQYKDDLSGATWTGLDVKTAESDGVNVIVTQPGVVRRFYRVQQL